MDKIVVDKILKKLDQLPEYVYPTEQSSVFLLPNGKMVGSDILFNHHKMLENIIGKKLDVYEFFKYLNMLQLIRFIVDDSILHVNINSSVTKDQKTILKMLGKYEKYVGCFIDTYSSYGIKYMKKNKLTLQYLYDLLGLKMPVYGK